MRFFRRREEPAPDISVERDFSLDSDWQPQESDFRRVLESHEIVEGRSETIEIKDTGVVITRFEGRVLAFLDVCPHWGSSFLDEPIENDTVRCPWHRWCWSLRTGELLFPTRSVNVPLRWIPARERDGWIEIALPPNVHATDRDARELRCR